MRQEGGQEEGESNSGGEGRRGKRRSGRKGKGKGKVKVRKRRRKGEQVHVRTWSVYVISRRQVNIFLNASLPILQQGKMNIFGTRKVSSPLGNAHNRPNKATTHTARIQL